MSVVKVKEVYFNLENGVFTPIFVLENGRIIEGWYTPTGNGWDLYFRFKEPQRDEVNYQDERIECIPCCNKECPFYDETFEQNCCGTINDEPTPYKCLIYEPETKTP
jgi:hypothetical protein